MIRDTDTLIELERAFAMSSAWDDMADAALARDDDTFRAAQTRFNTIHKGADNEPTCHN